MTDDTRARILRVALDLFAARGYHATSIREIAEKLDLTKTAVLYHFPSKKDILAALAEPMLTDMETAIATANRIDGTDPERKRWAVIEGLLDVWLSHRYLLRMQLQDLALASAGPVYERFRDAAMLAEHLIAGPVADHTDRIRAVQAFGMLSDPVVIFADLPTEMLRPAVLAGVERLLDETPPPRAAGPTRGAAVPRTRRRGRPGAMDPDMIETARRMHASGESATDIARALGVSRATVYRHLPRD
ncbi:TetR family transcriptional regulator [Actinomadura sp. HBU206391]|uniref:TetR family transcriptional regulator n=1 Tax=Actinomadura sp. HBU206391 TaxID=2731692 RepID=UPI00165061B9|nr:TetR family transcriptional regulator [Actinomadura sp. HBU206391]MBC6457001.1 TetR family transcriptional regulator [Actinomadura sp. HBU206391]